MTDTSCKAREDDDNRNVLKMNRYISFGVRMLLLLLFVVATAGVSAASQSPHLRRLLTLSDSDLLRKGAEYADRNENDSAAACYTIVVSRYDKSMSQEEKLDVVTSYERLWNIYFILYSDYNKAYECLSRAQAICDELGIRRSRLYIMYGATSQVIYNLYGDASKYKAAYKYYLAAFRQAQKEKNERTMSLAYSNLVLVAYDLHMLGQIAGVSKDYSSCRFADKTGLAANNILTYKGLLALERKKYDAATGYFARLLQTMPEDYSHVRFIYNNYLLLSRAEQCRKNYRAALDWLYKAAAICHRFSIADLDAELYNSLYKCYKDAGNRDSALFYRGKFLECKDKAMNYQNMQSLARLEFQNEMNGVTRKISEMKAAEKFHKTTLVIVSAFLAVFIFMSVFIFLRNRRLAASFRSLYQKNVELLRMQGQIDKMAKTDSGVQTIAAGEREENADVAACAAKRSKLKADEYDALLKKIRDVMKNPKYICNSDFSVEQLVSVVGAKYKTVLDVIHDEYGYNFSALLNKCRIEEACRRISEDSQVCNYTVEAIAGSVGYRSRTSFTTSFKVSPDSILRSISVWRKTNDVSFGVFWCPNF